MAAGVNSVIILNILLLNSCLPNKGDPIFPPYRWHQSQSNRQRENSVGPQSGMSSSQSHSYPSSINSGPYISSSYRSPSTQAETIAPYIGNLEGNSLRPRIGWSSHTPHAYPSSASTREISEIGRPYGYPSTQAAIPALDTTGRSYMPGFGNTRPIPALDATGRLYMTGFGNTPPGRGFPPSYPPGFGNTPPGRGFPPSYPPINYDPSRHLHKHQDFKYKPPKSIFYGQRRMSYPVYSGNLPPYINRYRRCPSKFKFLLTGLGLFNLGILSANKNARRFHKTYAPGIDEICSFEVNYGDGTYEEMGVDCRMITSFIWAANEPIMTTRTPVIPEIRTPQITAPPYLPQNIHTTQPQAKPPQAPPPVPQAPVPPPPPAPIDTKDNKISNDRGTTYLSEHMKRSMSPSITTYPNPYKSESEKEKFQVFVELGNRAPRSIGSLRIPDALDPKFYGEPIKLTPQMTCHVARRTSVSLVKKEVPCGILYTYTRQSFVPQGKSFGMRVGPSMKVLLLVAVLLIW